MAWRHFLCSYKSTVRTEVRQSVHRCTSTMTAIIPFNVPSSLHFPDNLHQGKWACNVNSTLPSGRVQVPDSGRMRMVSVRLSQRWGSENNFFCWCMAFSECKVIEGAVARPIKDIRILASGKNTHAMMITTIDIIAMYLILLSSFLYPSTIKNDNHFSLS